MVTGDPGMENPGKSLVLQDQKVESRDRTAVFRAKILTDGSLLTGRAGKFLSSRDKFARREAG
jgi:hypothetical protein